MADVMWARSDGTRVLLADRADTAAFVAAVYGFDEVHVVPLLVSRDARSIDVSAGPWTGLAGASGPLEIGLRAGPGWKLPPLALRPPWVTRFVEAPIARVGIGVRTFGSGQHGVREWYRAVEWRPVVAGAASLGDVPLGALGPIEPPLGVGFSEPPRRPSMVLVRPLLEDPTGRLDQVLAGLRPMVPDR